MATSGISRETWRDGIQFLLRLARVANAEGQKLIALELLKSAIMAEGMVA